MFTYFKTAYRMLCKFIKRVCLTILILLVLSVFAVLILRWINPPGTMLMVERKIEAWHTGSSLQLQRSWRDWPAISDTIKLAVIASEDQNFPKHHGFDMEAIKQALEHNSKGGTVRGASTITQQVSKNIFLWSGRSWFRKAIEFWFTIWIELLWPKERILEVYLNSAEWGEGIFGVEAASQHYFGVTAKQLTVQQACALAAVLPNPLQWSPAKPTPYIKQRMQWIQKQMTNLGGASFLEKLRVDTSD